MLANLPIGTSDFLKLREKGLVYVDKSHFVTDVLRTSAEVLLIPRPRRFGKTLNLSTLAAFVERTEEDRRAVFADLAVWQAGDDVRAHFGRHPVIFLTFKDVKARTWNDCRAAVSLLVAQVVAEHDALLGLLPRGTPNGSALRELRAGTADNATLWRSLSVLSECLHAATGEGVVILVDEYDTPIHAGFHHEYYDEVVELFRNLFSGAFKDNRHLHKGVLTGILRVAKESIFSGLNNLAVYSLLLPELSSCFGFTPEEVQALASQSGDAAPMAEIERWYDGYRFGDRVIYNPWSVLSHLASVDPTPRPHWVHTASDDLLRDLLVRRGLATHHDMETLLHGGTVTRRIDEHIVLRDLQRSSDAVWSLLLFSGYLKAVSARRPAGRLEVELAVPNLEVRTALTGLFEGFVAGALGGSERVQRLCAALLEGDSATFEELLEQLMLAALSYHDTAGSRPEAVYQAFVLGLLAALEPTHEITSNREAGRGRYDVLVSPRAPGQPGAVLELKVPDGRRGESAEAALRSALAQIRERDYAAALRERGAAPVHELCAVFDGKRAWVRSAREEPGA